MTTASLCSDAQAQQRASPITWVGLAIALFCADRCATRGLVFFSDINGLCCNMERVAHVGLRRRSLFDHSTR